MTLVRFVLASWHASFKTVCLDFLCTSAFIVAAFLFALLGVAEDSERKYPFPVAPRSILERLGELQLGEPPAIDPAEWEILEAAWALKDSRDADKQTPEYDQLVVKLMLTASGVATEESQAPFLRKVDALVGGARVEVEKGKPTMHPGDSLMRFLHAGVMHGGYESGQSSFTTVFDTGIYNCVSSTAIYYVVGRELAFQMQIISIPGGSFMSGHACLNLIDGDRVYEVEPTNPDGFDWATKLNQPGVFTIGFQPNRKDGHFVDGVGLAATIYSNRAVDALKAETPDRLGAASLGLRALMCDPYDATAAQNVLAVFTNWGPALASGGQYDEAVRALAFGYEVTQDGGVKNNLSVTASEQIASLLKAKQDQAAKVTIEHAATLLPDDNDFKNAEPWIRHANKSYDDDGGDAALLAIERALAMTSESDHIALRKSRTSLLRRWSQDLLEKSDTIGSVNVLARGYKIDTSDEDLSGGIAYHTQEALAILDKDGADPTAASAHVAVLVAEFPSITAIADFTSTHVYRALRALCEQERFLEAISTAGVYATIPCLKEESQQFTAQVWTDWAEFYSDEMKFDQAIAKYAEGLKTLPLNERLTQGLSRACTAKIEGLLKDKTDREAQAAIDYAAELLPDDGDFKNADPWIRYIRRCYEDESGDAAIDAIDRAAATTNENDKAAINACRITILRRWSQYLLDKSDVDGSMSVLSKGYAMNSADEELRSGIAYHTQEALAILDENGADPTAAVTHFRLLKSKFPDVEAVAGAALAHASRSIDSIAESKQFAYALSAADVYSVIGNPSEDHQQLQAQAWKCWARHLADDKKWIESLDKFAEGLKAIPSNERLTNGAVRVIDDWADESMTKNDWDGAIKIYDIGLKYFPENGHLMNNRQYCVAQKPEVEMPN